MSYLVSKAKLDSFASEYNMRRAYQIRLSFVCSMVCCLPCWDYIVLNKEILCWAELSSTRALLVS